MLAIASVRNEAAISPCIRTIQWRGQQGLYNECSLVSEVHWEVRMDAGQWGVQRWSMFMSCGLLTHRESKKAVGAAWAGLEECSLGGEISMVRV